MGNIVTEATHYWGNVLNIKKGDFLRYKYSPDDIVVQVKKIYENTPDAVSFLGLWCGYGVEQEIIITKENESSWEINK